MQDGDRQQIHGMIGIVPTTPCVVVGKDSYTEPLKELAKLIWSESVELFCLSFPRILKCDEVGS